MHINFALISRVLARAFMNAANRQRWTTAKIINYVAVIAVSTAIAWYLGQLQALREKSLTWILLLAAAAIVFFVEMIIQSYVATYDIGEEAGKATGTKVYLSELKRLYSAGQAIRLPDSRNVHDWSSLVSVELEKKLPAERFGFDSASDHLGQLGAMFDAAPVEHLKIRLKKLRAILMRMESAEDDRKP